MAFSRWDPVRDLLVLNERISRLADPCAPGWMPPADVLDSADRFVITVELPGLSQDDVRIEVRDGRLDLRGERPAAARGEQFQRVERGHGRFARSFDLPEAVDASRISAELRAGVLTVTVPKTGLPGRRIEVR